MNSFLVTVIVFIVSYSLIVTEKIPRSVAVIIGVFILLLFDVIDQEMAIEYIDFNTIGLLIGMMLLVAVMKRTGIFEYLAVKAIKGSNGNMWKLLVLFALITAVFSALLDNVTTVLIIAPITLALADALQINPTPYLVTEVFASNVGGTATLIGDPPNIIIGSSIKLSFMDFIYNNGPIVLIIMLFYLVSVKLIYYRELSADTTHPDLITLFDEEKIIDNFSMLKRSLLIFAMTMLLFTTHSIHGMEAATIALGSGFLLLLVTGFEPEEIFSELEYPTLFFLVGIFILVGALEHVQAIEIVSSFLLGFINGSEEMTVLAVLWFSGLSTSFVNNIPFTTIMIPIVKTIKTSANIGTDAIWWALSLGACLGGNGSLAGSAANIVVIALARKNHINISFWDFFKIAFPLMVGSLLLSSVYIYVRYLM